MEHLTRKIFEPIKKKRNLTSFILLLSLACLISCQPNSNKEPISIEAVVLKDSIIDSNNNSSKAIKNYEMAKQAYLQNTSDPDALIWYGRRTAYLGQYEDAINIFTTGIQEHPEDARMYRHRGHRYISTREYDKAISDFETAVKLIENKDDEIEPDGLPNDRNIPLTTLHGNIWYHLGLAYYLQNDLDNALKAFSNRTVTEKYPDNIVSGGHWLYMILRRMGKDKEANLAIKDVTTDMDIIENMSYHKMCQFYKGLISEQDLKPEGTRSASNDVLSYGLGNWYLYHQKDSLKAKEHYKHLLENGNKYSFAYLAAESDWNRIFNN